MEKIFRLVRNIYFNPWLIVELGLMLLFYPINVLLLIIWRIKFKFPIIFYGVPFIIKTTGSKIKIGKKFETKNGSWANLIGVNHRCCIATYTKEAKIIIGDNCGMSGGSIIAREEIVIGNNVMIGANCIIADNDFHPIAVQSRRYSIKDIKTNAIKIEDNVFIGANSIILKGVRIGKNSVIGAGSIVSRSIPANSIAAGNPARVIKVLK